MLERNMNSMSNVWVLCSEIPTVGCLLAWREWLTILFTYRWFYLTCSILCNRTKSTSTYDSYHLHCPSLVEFCERQLRSCLYVTHDDTAYIQQCFRRSNTAVIAQLGERKTEDLKVSANGCNARRMTVTQVMRSTVSQNFPVNLT